MTATLRQAVERAIALKTIDALLAAGFFVTVYDGEENVLIDSRSKADIYKKMFDTDECYLLVSREPDADDKFGWVRFVYGNDGYDVISDHTTNLEATLKYVDEFSDIFETNDLRDVHEANADKIAKALVEVQP